jgi:SOS-response transcriptional repressor LexA
MKKVATFTERLTQLFDTTEITAQEISLRTGISTAAMSRYRNGLRSAVAEHIEAIANAFDVPVGWLMGYDESPGRKTVSVPVIGNLKPDLPFFSESNVRYNLALPVIWGVDFAYENNTDSMLNAGIPIGSVMLFSSQSEIADGNIVICRVGKTRIVVARLQHQDTTLMLIPENPTAKVLFFNKKDQEQVTVLGKVKMVIKPL